MRPPGAVFSEGDWELPAGRARAIRPAPREGGVFVSERTDRFRWICDFTSIDPPHVSNDVFLLIWTLFRPAARREAWSIGRDSEAGDQTIERFLRPVCYQDFPAGLLPAALCDDNPQRVPRSLDGKISSDA